MDWNQVVPVNRSLYVRRHGLTMGAGRLEVRSSLLCSDHVRTACRRNMWDSTRNKESRKAVTYSTFKALRLFVTITLARPAAAHR